MNSQVLDFVCGKTLPSLENCKTLLVYERYQARKLTVLRSLASGYNPLQDHFPLTNHFTGSDLRYYMYELEQSCLSSISI
jgi:hypothetical protein